MRGIDAIAAVVLVSLSCSETGPLTGGQPHILWRVPSASSTETPHEPVANAARSMVYFVTSDYRLKKIRGQDGAIIWDVSVGPARPTPPGWNAMLAGGKVVVTKVDLFAFDTTSGAPKWTYVAPDLDETGYSAIVADDSTVYSASRTARVYAVDARTGLARWIVDLRGGSDNVGAMSPTLAHGMLYVCTRTILGAPTGTLWAIDAATGEKRWTHAFTPLLPQQGSRCFGHAAVWRDLVIQPQEDGRVFAFERTTGDVRWIAPRVHDVGVSLGDIRYPAVGDSSLLVTSIANTGMIVAYDPMTGAERWRYTRNSGSLYPPVIEGDIAYVYHSWIFASYDVRTGMVRWQTPQSTSDPATPLTGRPVIGSDRIFIAGRDGSYALQP